MLLADMNTFLGVGIYCVPEASRLTGVSPSRIRRWLKGYTFDYDGNQHESPPVWQGQMLSTEGSLALGFLDLMEIRFIDAFREHGVSWKTIRLAAERARELFNQTHPFCTKRFKTDGRDIFAEVIHETGESDLLDVVKSQYAFKRILEPYLYKGLEFDEHENLVRWRPLGKRSRIVIDPQRSFGQPVVEKEGVPTTVLAQAYRAEKAIDRVARWYDVDRRSVREAIQYEENLAA